jgi:mono/diheme cytochrome c family protein
MKQHSETTALFLPVKAITVITIILFVIAITTSAFKDKHLKVIHDDINKDSVESVKAFMEVYKVLMSPRCMNCHPAGEQPLQGDDNHIHTMNVQRGKDGKGIYAVKCSNCHQPENTPGLHTPPGNPNGSCRRQI